MLDITNPPLLNKNIRFISGKAGSGKTKEALKFCSENNYALVTKDRPHNILFICYKFNIVPPYVIFGVTSLNELNTYIQKDRKFVIDNYDLFLNNPEKLLERKDIAGITLNQRN